MGIRSVKQEDYAQCMCLIADWAVESISEYGVFLEVDHLKKVFDILWRTSFVMEVEDRIVGVLAGHLVTDFCSKRQAYEEVFWFMDEEHRKYGVKLFRYVEQRCKEKGIDRMTMACMHNSKTEKLFRFYKRLGYKPMETRFIKQLD